MYERSAHIGDYVYADGSFSDQYDGSKTVVGICFYLLHNQDGSDALRLAVAPSAIGSYAWGLYNNASNGIANVVVEEGLYNAYDTPMANISTNGIVKTAVGGTAGYVSDATYRDESDSGDEFGFKVFTEADTAVNTLGLMTLGGAFHGHTAGEKVPYGWYYSQVVLDHRDRVLADLNYDIPAASDVETEIEALRRLLTDIRAEGGATKYGQFYYEAVSFCHAYEPLALKAGEVLSDKFKSGKWWLPSPGELCRLYWYHSKGYAGADYAIFSEAYTKGLFSQFASSNHWTSLEYSATYAWYVNFSSGQLVINTYKYHSGVVRAVVAF